MQAHTGCVRKHAGFTLVELVVVVMILGILAAVAAPRLLGTSAAATENGVRHTLAVVRDAIERYAADNGGDRPPGTDLGAELEDYLRGRFPTCPVAGQTNDVEVVAVGVLDAPPNSANGSWRYSSATGEFIVNSDEMLEDGTTMYSQL